MLNHRIMTGLMGAMLVVTAVANVQESPYRVIAARNPFGLRPIPVPVEKAPEPPPARPLPEIKFTGITTLLGAAMVTLQYEDKEAKKMEFPPLLREGGKYKDLVVEHIDTDNQTVVIWHGEVRKTLDFIHDGVKPSTQPAMVASTAPAPNIPAPRVLGSSNVFIGNAPNSSPSLTPEQQRIRAEMLLRLKTAQEQGKARAPRPPGFPSSPNGTIPASFPH